MGETYTSGSWKAKQGHEDDFVEAWKEFVSWAKDQPGSGRFRLVRDVEDPASRSAATGRGLAESA
jgi:heme-degrading monooxygenase HmoA